MLLWKCFGIYPNLRDLLDRMADDCQKSLNCEFHFMVPCVSTYDLITNFFHRDGRVGTLKGKFHFMAHVCRHLRSYNKLCSNFTLWCVLHFLESGYHYSRIVQGHVPRHCDMLSYVGCGPVEQVTCLSHLIQQIAPTCERQPGRLCKGGVALVLTSSHGQTRCLPSPWSDDQLRL